LTLLGFAASFGRRAEERAGNAYPTKGDDMSRKLCLFASALTLTCSGAALAQSTTPDTKTASASGIETVVVTAERRATNLQDTAIAASVLSGADLVKKGVTSVDQLQSVMPSVSVQNFGQGNDFNVRGIGKGEQNSATLVGVVTYRDGVATFPGYFQDEPFYDIASLEVLRGPQGTFAGQNATGGAVFITEVNPNFDGVNGYVQGQYGNYNDVGVQGAVNIPLDDTLALRVAFNDEYRDSFYKVAGPFTGNPGRLKSTSARVSLLWEPVTELKVLFKTDFNYVDLGGVPADPVNTPEDPFHITSNAHHTYFDRFVRSVLDVSYQFGGGITLHSISGYQLGRTAFKADLDGTSLLPLTFEDGADEEIYAQEFNLVSPDTGPLTWVAGVYYSSDKLTFPGTAFDIGLPKGTLDEILTGTNPKQTEAVFAQASYDLPAGFQLQVGARYTDFRTSNHAFEIIPQFFLTIPDNQAEHDSRLTGKIALNWKINPDNFLYAFVATGHKGGGLNTPSLTTFQLQPLFKPENVTDYEAGWKSTFLDGQVRTQIGGYYNQYENFQVSIGNPLSPVSALEVNVPSTSKIYGMEAQADAAFGALSFDFGVSWLHSDLGTFFAVDPRAAALGACNPKTGPVTASCLNLTGNSQVYAPTFTFNVGAQYVFDLGSGDTLTPRANFGHVGEQWATLFENIGRGDLLTERNLLSAQLSYETGEWDFTAYGTNLTDQHYISAINSGLRYEGAPRQYGLRLTKTF
jgi:iron complex outermembrane receptor protein